jgi:hypothetical protein
MIANTENFKIPKKHQLPSVIEEVIVFSLSDRVTILFSDLSSPLLWETLYNPAGTTAE